MKKKERDMKAILQMMGYVHDYIAKIDAKQTFKAHRVDALEVIDRKAGKASVIG